MRFINHVWKDKIEITVCLLLFFLLTACQSDKNLQPDKPNIILFLVDDMGLMDTSTPMLADALGNPIRYPLNDWYRTPNMEELSKLGVRFSDFYAQTVCSPSRISILTGQNSARHRTTTWINPFKKNGKKSDPPEWNWKGLDKNEITLPKILKQSGYKNIFIGKAHFGPFGYSGADPLNLGFDVNIGGNAIGSPGSYYGSDGFGLMTKHREREAVPHLEKYHNQDIYLTEALTLEAKAQIDSAVLAKEPFFLDMSHYAVHWPYQPDKRFIDNYADSNLSEDAKSYASMIEGIDKSLGDLVSYLKKKNIADNTLIIFLGDNGSAAPIGTNKTIASSAPLRGKKRSKFEGGTRVPFIASWGALNPKNSWQKKLPITSGVIQNRIGTCDDIFSTIVDLLELKVPKSHITDGQSLVPLLTGQVDAKRKDIFLSHFPHASESYTSYRNGKWKLIYNYFSELKNKSTPYELYNLESDPSESNETAKQHMDVVKVLMKEMINDLNAKNALYLVDSLGNEVRPQ